MSFHFLKLGKKNGHVLQRDRFHSSNQISVRRKSEFEASP